MKVIHREFDRSKSIGLTDPDILEQIIRRLTPISPLLSNNVLGGYETIDIINHGMPKEQVDAIVELCPLPKFLPKLLSEEDESSELHLFEVEVSEVSEEEEGPEVEEEEEEEEECNDPRFNILRRAAASIHIFTNLWRCNGNIPTYLKGCTLISVIRVSEVKIPSFMSSLPGCGSNWYYAAKINASGVWLLADVQMPSSRVIQVELPLACIRVWFPDGDNNLLLQASTKSRIEACAREAVKWKPDEATEELLVLSGSAIKFPSRWLQHEGSILGRRPMLDSFGNFVPLPEFKSYIEDLMRCKSISDNQDTCDEIIDLQRKQKHMEAAYSLTFKKQ
jgi:hypothetical protein